VSGFVKNETAALQKDGAFIGQKTKNLTETTEYNDSGDVVKFENTLKLFVNGDLGESSALHAELNLVVDPEGEGSHYEAHESYTQNDYLRELYVDTMLGDGGVELRLGKQQVVWGTADGAKLLDIINPTDYREMAQNTMEDSRVPVWMAKLEMPAGDSGTVQFIAAQPRENVFAGLNRKISTSNRANNAVTSLTSSPDIVIQGHDKNNPYIMKGVDSITGQVNGFVNIVPDLGSVATMFGMAFGSSGSPNGLDPSNHGAMNYFTVGSFDTTAATLAGFSNQYEAMVVSGGSATALALGGTSGFVADDGFGDLIFGTTAFWTTDSGGNTVAANDPNAGTYFTGQAALAGFAAMYGTNLHFTDSTINSTFEYMDRTPFSTFDAFVYATSEYKFDMPDDLDLDLAIRYKDSLDNGLSYSLNYAYAYDKNPIINLSWRNSAGNEIYACRNTDSGSGNTYLTLENNANCSGSAAYGGAAGDYATLRFEQTVKRAHNFGSALDYTLDTESLGGVVLRGEFLYQKDVYTPVMDRGALSIGDLTKALTMRKGDRFKYVLGADITVLTNMLVSGQFIQDRNLDYVDSSVDFNGSTACSSVSSSNCGVYTVDYATMHLTNGFNKAEKNKNFYSLFLSKPFGPNQLGRWNNIFMFEENGGKWNRFDVEYSFTDEMVGLFELNNYWGDKNTQFGQLEDASNVQVGFKYLF